MKIAPPLGGDLIGGSWNSYVATPVERHPRYVMLVKVVNKDTERVVSALIKQSQKLPGELCRSLTWDSGKECTNHQSRFRKSEQDDKWSFCLKAACLLQGIVVGPTV